MKKHLRTTVAAFSVLGLALVGCENGDTTTTDDPGLEGDTTTDDTLEGDDGMDDGMDDDMEGDDTLDDDAEDNG
jgi:hypothetical protein